MSIGSTPAGTDSGLEAAASAFETLLSGDSQDTEDENEAQQDNEPNGDDATDRENPVDGEEDEGEESEESEGDESEDESDEDEETDEDEEQEPVYAVKVDGQEIEVPLSELVKGYSRTADYTRKTQELASVRKQVEAVAQESVAVRDQYAEKLGQLQQLLQQQAPQEPNWEKLRAEDPIEFAAQWAEHQRLQQYRYQVEAERQAIMQQQQAEQVQVTQQQLEQARNWLTEVGIPEWKDAEKAKAERAALKTYGQKYGYSAEELSQVADPRAVVLLRKAMLYDKLQERKGQITPVKKTATPVLKPGASSKPVTKKSSEMKSAKQRLAKSGSVRDAAEVFKSFL